MPITVENIAYTYNIGTPAESAALRGVSLAVDRGEWVSIVGHTGSGKSTLAQHLNVLLIAQSGSVSIDGTEVSEKSKKLRELRKKVGLVFQYPEQQFFADSVRAEIEFGPSNWGVSGEDLERHVELAVESTGLNRELLASNPFALSGGQKRRVALASVIASKPDYLVLDEPTAGLDATGVRELFQLLARIKAEGMAVVQVTHDLASALVYSDRILVLEDGKSVCYGDTGTVAEFLLENPVRGLLLPPLVKFCSGLRRRGFDVPLTLGVSEIVAALDELREKKNS